MAVSIISSYNRTDWRANNLNDFVILLVTLVTNLGRIELLDQFRETALSTFLGQLVVDAYNSPFPVGLNLAAPFKINSIDSHFTKDPELVASSDRL